MLGQKRIGHKHWFRKLRMSTKIMLSSAVMIFCSNLLLLTIGCLVSVQTIRNQMQEQVQSQLNLTQTSVSGIINDVGKLMVTLSTAEDISVFVGNARQTHSQHLANQNGVNEILRILKLSSSQIDYAALLRIDQKDPLYVGREINNELIYERMLKDAEKAKVKTDNGFSMYLMQDMYRDPELNLFCPVFERHTLMSKPSAYLVVGLNIANLSENLWEESDGQSIRILDNDGKIFMSKTLAEIGLTRKNYSENQEPSGRNESPDSIVIYQRFSHPNLIVEGTVDKTLYKNTIRRVAEKLTHGIIIFTLIAIFVIYSLCRYFYVPMEEMLQTMRSVGAGDLDKKMKAYEQSDFGQISDTFNSMTDSLKDQMEMIRLKEQENTEIRLNALQSQIKPHFLYNTLESIHWQSLLEGAPGVSKMVMALSRFYRLSLSKGAELIPLSQELEHTDSYVTIQNNRFDHILQMEYDIPDEMMQFDIPKITLQPLVENAFYHGIKPRGGKNGHVKISGCLEDGYMILRVSDNGIGMTDEQIRNLNENINNLINDGSYGVKNVHNRLEIRYGAGNGLHYEKNPEGGVTVTVRLPARKAI